MDEANYDLVDLHKNVVDEITLVSASGKPMKREADLIDVWFDSGSMPYAQWHYPFENKDKIDANKDFPGISLLKVWIRLVDGSIRYMRLRL
jgi:isoleucyl-tRNA synthetase